MKNKAVSLLRWSEKYTKTDMVYLATGGFWLSIGQWATSLSALALAVVLANILPKETYGLYKYILSLTSLLSIPVLSGIDVAVAKAIANGNGATFLEGFKTKMKWGVLSSICSLVGGMYYIYNGNSILGISFLIVAILMPTTRALDLYNSILQAKKEFKFFTFCNSFTQILTTLALIGFVLIDQSLIGLVAVFFLSNLIVNFIFFRLTQKKLSLEGPLDPEAIRYGKHLTLIGVVGLLVAEIDKILVFQLLGSAELAIYVLAVAPTDQLKGLFKNIPFLAFPKFAEKPKEEVRPTLIRKAFTLSLAVGAMVLVYIIIAPLFFHIFFPEYSESIRYSQVLSISIVFIIPALLTSIFMESQGMTKEIYKYNMFFNIVSLALVFPLAYIWGIWGVIVARIVSRLFTFVYSLYLVNVMNVNRS